MQCCSILTRSLRRDWSKLGIVQWRFFQLNLKRVGVWDSQISGVVRDSVYAYSTSQVFYGEESTQLESGTAVRVRKLRTFDQSIRIVLDDQELTSTTGVHARLKSNVKMSGFPILPSYCRDVPIAIDSTRILQTLSVTRPCVQCSSTMEDIQLQRCMRGRTRLRTY